MRKLGRRADLLLLNANPLRDIENISKPDGVTENGRWYSEEQLRQQLNDLKASYQR
jgi:imidazolonepropionase-like amidohydrolase